MSDDLSNYTIMKLSCSSGELLSTYCMDRHPNQPHLVIAGCDNGLICFWDLRQEKQPLTMIKAHASDG